MNKTNNKARFLISRKELLYHLSETEKLLVEKTSSLKRNDSYYQEQLIKKYLILQDDLNQLKQIALKLKNGQQNTLQDKNWDNKKIYNELHLILNTFTNFIKKNGFIPS